LIKNYVSAKRLCSSTLRMSTPRWRCAWWLLLLARTSTFARRFWKYTLLETKQSFCPNFNFSLNLKRATSLPSLARSSSSCCCTPLLTMARTRSFVSVTCWALRAWPVFLYLRIWFWNITVQGNFSNHFPGLSTGPLLDVAVAIDSSIVATAFLGTSVVFGCFSLAALYAPDRKYLYLGGEWRHNSHRYVLVNHIPQIQARCFRWWAPCSGWRCSTCSSARTLSSSSTCTWGWWSCAALSSTTRSWLWRSAVVAIATTSGEIWNVAISHLHET